MNIQSLLNDVAKRYNESKRKENKSRVHQSLIDDVGNRFRSFVQERVQSQVNKPLHEITRAIQEMPRVGQHEIDEVGNRFKSFMADKDHVASDVASRFDEFKTKASQYAHETGKYIGDQPLVPQFGKYSPTVGQGTEFVAGIPRAVVRRGFEGAQTVAGDMNVYTPQEGFQQFAMGKDKLYNMTDPRRPSGELLHGVGLSDDDVKKYTPLLAGIGAIADVTPFGMGKGKVAEEVGEQGLKQFGKEGIEQLAKGASKEWISAFQTWVNTRASTKFSGIMKKLEFSDLDKEGITGIFKFQAGDKSGRYGDVMNFFDNRYKELKKAGIESLQYKKDYLPQLWMNTSEEVEEVLGRTLSTKPSFSLKSLIKSYQEGMSIRTERYPNGLTPRFTKLSDLIGWYEQTSSKALADHHFFNYLKKSGHILPEDKAPEFWKTIDAERFPKEVTKAGNEVISRSFKAEPKLARAIDNYLVDPKGKLQSFANFATIAKNLGLSAGVPHTSINFHGFNIFVRSVLSSRNPATAIFRTSQWMIKPNTAQQFVEHNLNDAVFFVKNGLTMNMEDYAFQKEATQQMKGLVGNTLGKFEEWFGDPLFQQTLPALKIQYTRALYDDLLKNLPAEKAIKDAVHSANNVFGGINVTELMRSKTTQNILRSVFLAPDWAESSIRMGAGVLKGLANPLSPEYKAYRVFTKNYLFSYIAANVTNKALSGHWMYENEGSNKFNLDTGTYTGDGKKRYFKIYGTAVDFTRIPQEVISGLINQDPTAVKRAVSNRLSLPVGSAFHLATNQDFVERGIYGNDKWGNPIPTDQAIGGITNEVARGLGVPSQGLALIDLASGRANLEQTGAQLTEFPMSYSGGANTDTQKRKQAMLQSVGFEGEDLAQEMERTKNFRWNGNQEAEKSLFDHVVDKFKGIFGKQESNRPQPNDPLTKAFLSDIEKDERATGIREVFKLGYSKEQTEKLLKERGLGTYEEAQLVIMKALGVENGSRGSYINEMIKGMDADSKQKTLFYLAENEVLTTSVISKWVDDGKITEEEADYLKDMIKETKGTFKAKKGKGGKTSMKQVTAGSVPTIKVPTFAGSITKSVGHAYYKPIPKVQFSSTVPTSRTQKVSAPKPETNYKSYGGSK